MNPPNVLDIELSTEEVQGNLVKIVRSMTEMRSEAVKNKSFIEAQHEEYVHLVYRLASCIEGLISDPLIVAMDEIVTCMTVNHDLINYDPLQDDYWKEKIQGLKFSKTLDLILISLLKDNFNLIEEKYHLLQAVKYLAISNSSDEDKQEVFNTMKPFQKAVSFESSKKRNWLERIIIYFFGEVYNLESIDDLTIEMKEVTNVEPIIVEARKRGFTHLKFGLLYGDYKKQEEELKPYVRGTEEANVVSGKTKYYINEGRIVGKETVVFLELPLTKQNIPVQTFSPEEFYKKIIEWESSKPFNIRLFNKTSSQITHPEMTDEFKEQVGSLPKQLTQTIDIEEKALIYSSKKTIHPYTKQSAIFKFEQDSYIIEVISSKESGYCIENASRVLSKNENVAKKTLMIEQLFNPDYIRVRQFVKGVEVESQERFRVEGG